MSEQAGSDQLVLPAGTVRERWVRMTRRLISSPDRAYRCFSDPETLARWFPDRVEGSLAPNSRTTLVWPRQRVWWDVVVAESDRRFQARWPWLPDESLVTTFTVTFQRRGYGSLITLEDGPFPIDRPGVLDAWVQAVAGWTEAMDQLRAYLDFSVDIRERSYEAEA